MMSDELITMIVEHVFKRRIQWINEQGNKVGAVSIHHFICINVWICPEVKKVEITFINPTPYVTESLDKIINSCKCDFYSYHCVEDVTKIDNRLIIKYQKNDL